MDHHSGIFIFLNARNWKILHTYLLNMALCDLGTWCSLACYGLESGCSNIYTGLFLQVHSFMFKRNLYLLNTLWIMSHYYYYKFLLSYVELQR